MSLSKRSIATLLDLVEIKLSCIEVMDREDAQEVAALEGAKRELTAIMQAQSQARRNAEEAMTADISDRAVLVHA